MLKRIMGDSETTSRNDCGAGLEICDPDVALEFPEHVQLFWKKTKQSIFSIFRKM